MIEPNITERKTANLQASLMSYSPATEEGALLARIVSIVLHPILMGIYTVALLFFYTDFNLIFAGQFLRFLSPVFFLTCVVPLSSMYFLSKSGLMDSYRINPSRQRIIPFLIIFISYSLLIYYFHAAKLYVWFISILAVPLILVVILGVISAYWKISIHMAAIGALIGSTLSVCYNVKGVNPFILFIILFILAGCLGVARLSLKKNTPAQVYIGFFVGAVVSYLCVLFGAYWGVINL